MTPAKSRRRKVDFIRKPVKQKQKAPMDVEAMIVGAAATMGFGDTTTFQTKLGASPGSRGMVPLKTVRKYYRNNWELMQSQPDILGPSEDTIARIIGPGACVIQNGTLMQPEGDFAKLFREMIEPCLSRSFRWLICYAYVVWAKTTDESGTPFIFVPDPDQVEVTFNYNKLTGAPETTVKWTSKDIDPEASILHFFSDSVLGISKGFQASPVDAASSVIDRIVSIRLSFHRILERIAAAPIAVEDQQRNLAANAQKHLIDIHPSEIEPFLDAEQLAIRDSTARDRLYSIIDAANDDAEMNLEQEPQLVSPEARMMRAMAAPVENSFVSIPPGMHASAIQPPGYFSDFNATDERLMRQVSRLMGMDASAAPVSNKNKEGVVSGGSGLAGTFTDKQKAWQKALSELATLMIETLYPAEKFRVILMSQVYPDRDLCQQLVAQGSMSEESFRALHPNTLEETKSTDKK